MSVGAFVQPKCEFVPVAEAESMEAAQQHALDLIEARIPAFLIRVAAWPNISGDREQEAALPEVYGRALKGAVVMGEMVYSISGRGSYGAHVDEQPDILGAYEGFGRFNAHTVRVGRITFRGLFTRPGYYSQGDGWREPVTFYNRGIGEDLERGQEINPLTTEHTVHEADLQPGDTVFFFERAAKTVDGPPNVVHMFHRGSLDRTSQVVQHHALRT